MFEGECGSVHTCVQVFEIACDVVCEFLCV